MKYKKIVVIKDSDIYHTELIVDMLKKNGCFAVESVDFLKNINILFGQAETLFKKFAKIEQFKVSLIEQSIYNVYLAPGIENITKSTADCKSVIDIFPRESYSYKYYSDSGIISNCRTYKMSEKKSKLRNNLYSALLYLEQLFTEIIKKFLPYQPHLTSIRNTNWLIRIIHYPPIPNSDTIRLAEHVDDDVLAMVITNDYSSLEIEDEQGQFTKIEAPSGSLIILAGNCLEFISNAAIRGLKHRVVGGISPNKSRYSFNINMGFDLAIPTISDYYTNILQRKYFLQTR